MASHCTAHMMNKAKAKIFLHCFTILLSWRATLVSSNFFHEDRPDISISHLLQGAGVSKELLSTEHEAV